MNYCGLVHGLFFYRTGWDIFGVNNFIADLRKSELMFILIVAIDRLV
jgi:hypothetical protein